MTTTTDETELAPCARRNWVLSVLTDDEAIEPGGALPQGLSLHLAQCAECRALAEDLQLTSGLLAEAGTESLPADLADRAVARVQAVAAAGVAFSGRVEVAVDDVDQFERRTPAWWGRPGWMAAAACVGLMLASWGIYKSTVRPVPNRVPVIADSGHDAGQPEPAPATPSEDGNPDSALAVAEPAAEEPHICIHHSHLEAAMCDKPHAIHTATVLRDRPKRRSGWADVLFDRDQPSESTLLGNGKP